ncbi:MAG TPA: hypothetical protein VE359_23855 [Vicinamibacteria bacterium]|nr:hypothetical protein [Vicinamibacteria bacterium]
MRSLRTVLVVAVALGVSSIALAQAPPDLAKKGPLPPGLAKKFGPELPEEIWIAFHPTRDDGAWFLIDYEWTLMTGFSAGVRAEVKEARKRPASVPPIPPPNVGVALRVVQFQ